MKNRLRSWTVAQTARGDWSVSHGHRSTHQGLSTRHAALQVVAQHHRPGEKVFEAETDDGYLSDITHDLVRKHVISGRPSQSRATGRPHRSHPVESEQRQRLQLPFVTAFGARRGPTVTRDLPKKQ